MYLIIRILKFAHRVEKKIKMKLSTLVDEKEDIFETFKQFII